MEGFGVTVAFFVEKLGTQRVGANWFGYANLTEDVYNSQLLRAETRFGTIEPTVPEVDAQWQVVGMDWTADLNKINNPINYDKYSRRVEEPCVIELAQIWRFTVITIRDTPGIGQGAFLAALTGEFPRSPYDFVNLFTWLIENNTSGNTWQDLKDVVLDNLGNFDLGTWPYTFIGVERPF